MLCSISGTGKSSSKWLDKLRSSKGFPSTADDLDLEQFLNHNNKNTEQESISTSTSDPNRSRNDPPELLRYQSLEAQNSDEDGNGDTRILSLMSNVLAEIFVMGNNSNNLPKFKRSSRKQRNPKFCAFNLDCPESNNNTNESDSPITDDNSGVGTTKDRRRSDEQLKLVGNEEEGCVNLSGFSRTEITVIDTSFATWKFEKMLFMKENVWKVRDKKGKTVILGKKKKRKANANLDDQYSNGTEEKKKQKVLHGQCSLSKKGCGEVFHEEHHQPNKSDMYGKSCKKNQENLVAQEFTERKFISDSHKSHTYK